MTAVLFQLLITRICCIPDLIKKSPNGNSEAQYGKSLFDERKYNDNDPTQEFVEDKISIPLNEAIVNKAGLKRLDGFKFFGLDFNQPDQIGGDVKVRTLNFIPGFYMKFEKYHLLLSTP